MDYHGSESAGTEATVKEAIETRELITVSVDGVRLRGTYHRICQDRVSRSSRPGVFFFNPGFLPRAGTGDSAVDFAETLAKNGYKCFRFDVPGLGDSDGEPAEDVISSTPGNMPRFCPPRSRNSSSGTICRGWSS